MAVSKEELAVWMGGWVVVTTQGSHQEREDFLKKLPLEIREELWECAQSLASGIVRHTWKKHVADVSGMGED